MFELCQETIFITGVAGETREMSISLVDDREVLIIEESRYVKMSVRRDIEEIFAEIMNDSLFMNYFYNRFEKNVKLMNDLFAHVNDMTPEERIIRISNLPPIPTFICDAKCTYLKINKNQFNAINKFSTSLKILPRSLISNTPQ